MKYLNCIIGTALILFDQVTKHMAEQWCVIPKIMTPFLSLELAHNTGVSFGMGAHQGPLVFWGLAACTAIVLLLFARLMIQESKRGVFVGGYVLLVAGGVSNLIDRVWHRHVIDFIHVHYENWSFPYFNVADMCIVIGVAVVMVQIFKDYEK